MFALMGCGDGVVVVIGNGGCNILEVRLDKGATKQELIESCLAEERKRQLPQGGLNILEGGVGERARPSEWMAKGTFVSCVKVILHLERTNDGRGRSKNLVNNVLMFKLIYPLPE